MVNQKVQLNRINKNNGVINFICGTLKWEILNGHYSVGERITEQSVAERLGVSRNSVGNALFKLRGGSFN